MFKKENRLGSSIRFLNPVVYNTAYFTLKIAKNDTKNNRFGFIVTKKVDKRAVVRNKVKRKVRLCFEGLKLDIKPGYDMLCFIKAPATDSTFELLRDTIIKLLKKEKLLNEAINNSNY